MTVTTTEAPPQLAGIVQAALDWLYEVEQPAGSIPELAGYTYQWGEWTYTVAPYGRDDLPVIVIAPAWPERDQHNRVTNPPPLLELDQMRRIPELADRIRMVFESNGSRTLCLDKEPHPSLVEGLRRLVAGCPSHDGSQWCAATSGCDWRVRGQRLIITPAWPA